MILKHRGINKRFPTGVDFSAELSSRLLADIGLHSSLFSCRTGLIKIILPFIFHFPMLSMFYTHFNLKNNAVSYWVVLFRLLQSACVWVLSSLPLPFFPSKAVKMFKTCQTIFKLLRWKWSSFHKHNPQFHTKSLRPFKGWLSYVRRGLILLRNALFFEGYLVYVCAGSTSFWHRNLVNLPYKITVCSEYKRNKCTAMGKRLSLPFRAEGH